MTQLTDSPAHSSGKKAVTAEQVENRAFAAKAPAADVQSGSEHSVSFATPLLVTLLAVLLESDCRPSTTNCYHTPLGKPLRIYFRVLQPNTFANTVITPITSDPVHVGILD